MTGSRRTDPPTSLKFTQTLEISDKMCVSVGILSECVEWEEPCTVEPLLLSLSSHPGRAANLFIRAPRSGPD